VKAAILILHIGGGHMEAAKNIKAELEEQGVEVRIIDGLELTFRWFARFFKWWWFAMQHTAPGIWGWMYESKLFSSSFFSVWMYHIPWWGMRRELREFKPDMVFNCHFVGNAVSLRVKKEAKGALDKMKINYICTELIWVPNYFVWPEVDRFFLSNDAQIEEGIKVGIPREIMKTTGIPIKKAFAKELSREAAREQLEIPQDKKVLFFFAGTFGGVALDKLVDGIKDKDVYPVVVCGRNEAVKARLEELLEQNKMDGKIYGFVDFMDVIMRGADLMVGKGGALMCAESIATGCPVLLYGSPPGHELENAKHIEAFGGGIVTETVEDVLRSIDELLSDPDRLVKMHEALVERGHPTAARDIVQIALADKKQLEG
jgi:processive 1,2-diacylglycerol beta-glucosyltransferase